MPSRTSILNALLAVVAVAGGIFIGYADSHSDDAGITLLALLVLTFMLGFVGPRRAWRWALLAGIWVPLLDWILPPAELAPRDPGLPRTALSFLALTAVVMAGCFAAAYAGALVARAVRRSFGPAQGSSAKS